MKNLSKHAEWLSLIEISGPFLTVSMLDKAFPQGLEAVETPRRQKLGAAYEEWREAVDREDNLLPKLHREWVHLVLTEMLEYDRESLVHAGDWSGKLPSVSSQEHAGRLEPDWIVRSPADGKPRLFIAVLPPDTDLESVQRGDGWPVSLQERMTQLCRAHGVRVGLLTDGERWMLVNAPVGSTSSQVSWYAHLWFQEPITLKAFQSLLGVRRCFGPAEDTLESLLDESLEHHEEVTDTLGEQVRRAVEVLVQCLDKADEDRNRELLRDVKPTELYEAGLTVMMRLVFVLCAEERGLLLLGDSVYDRCYAVSTLRGQLAEEADRHGPEVLDRRHDAWARLLAVFCAVYGGIEHESLRMPALGGSLFDPDRFPFLEGRAKGTRWRDTTAAPLPIDNRTVLLLLNSLQILEQSGGALLLSYRALDVEQIGHVYEGLLEHTVARVPRVTLGLQGSRKAKNPNVALAELESARLDGEAALVKLVLDVTGRSESAIRNGLSKPADDTVFGRVSGVCGGDTALAERIRPFTNLLRTDAWDDPIVYRANSFRVTLGADRRETGTHYTPRSLTESIVSTTLEPVVYIGPAEGKPREEWTLKSSREILDLKVCDPAMGSGAFLVQTCRYLGEKLVEAWLHEEAAGNAITVDGEALDQLGAEESLPSQLDERLTIARRLVAERCLYGVDINPLAVELAKLSIWLVTLAKGRPFGFLDHNLRSGDSLLGIHRLDQLTKLSMNPDRQGFRLFGQNIEAAVNEATELRQRLRTKTIRDIKDIEAMARLNREALKKLESVELIADAMIGEVLRCGGNARALDTALDTLAAMAGDFLGGNEKMGGQIARQARANLAIDLPEDKPQRRPIHWALELPEVFKEGGFDAVIGNPPFVKGTSISGVLGAAYRKYIGNTLGRGKKASYADLCSFFLLRAHSLLNLHGSTGLVATNTISQGDTREMGLDQLFADGFRPYWVMTDVVWSGVASVMVSLLAMRLKDQWLGLRVLNSEKLDEITQYLTVGSGNVFQPNRLARNKGIAFKGSTTGCKGFVLTDSEAKELIARDKMYADVVQPFLGGQDFNSSPTMTTSRWVINFRDWDYQKAAQYPACLQLLEKRVKPYFDSRTGQIHERDYWKFSDKRLESYKLIKTFDRVLFHAFTSKHLSFGFVRADIVYSAPHVVVALQGDEDFAILQSSIHLLWVIEICSTMGTGIRYAPSDLLETFPFPPKTLDKNADEKIAILGRRYYQERSAFMESCGIGLTEFYNRFHSESEHDPQIEMVRNIHVEIDQELCKRYSIYESIEHQFIETKIGIRYLPSSMSQSRIISKLKELNGQYYQEEFSQGLHNGLSKDGASRKSSRKSGLIQDGLNFDDSDLVNRTAATSRNELTAISEFLRLHPRWCSKSEILSATGISESRWNCSITVLISDGLVERQGERRGTRYRVARKVDLDE